MKKRLRDRRQMLSRAIVTSGFITAFLFTIVLSAAPQLHERVHEPSQVAHQCAVTLLASGNCEHTPCDAIVIRPLPPKAPALLFCHLAYFVGPGLDFSLLEHAPPAFS